MKKIPYYLGLIALLAASACATHESGNYPEGLPAELRHAPIDGSLPEMIFNCDSSIVTIEFLGGLPESGSQMNVTVQSAAQFNELSPINLDSTGRVELALPLQGTSVIQLALNDFDERIGSVWVAPGEDTKVYVDYRPDSLVDDDRRLYSTGIYGELTGMASKYSGNWLHNISPLMPGFGEYNMTGDEFVKITAQAYADSLSAIENDNLPEMVKELAKVNLKSSIIMLPEFKDYIIKGSYAENHPEDPKVNPDSVILSFSDDNIREILRIADANDNSILMAHQMPLSMGLKKINWSAGGTQNNLISEISTYQNIADKATSGKYTEEDRQTLSSLGNAEFYITSCEILKDQYESKLAEAQKMILTLPEEIPDNKIIEIIAAPHKGKVVIIDMWNTWCTPCRAAIAENEPLKKTTLNNPDIVFVYVADDSSPLPLYVSMIPEIKGEHYRLTRDQAIEVGKIFNIEGIPYYILVDRDGNIEGRPDFRDHDIYVKTLLEKL